VSGRLEGGKCRHVQILELFSMEICDQAVMDALPRNHGGEEVPTPLSRTECI